MTVAFESARAQVVQQAADGGIKLRQKLVLQLREVPAMRVPGGVRVGRPRDAGQARPGLGTQAQDAVLREHADQNGGGTISWITADDNLTAQSVYNKLATRAKWVTYEMS